MCLQNGKVNFTDFFLLLPVLQKTVWAADKIMQQQQQQQRSTNGGSQPRSVSLQPCCFGHNVGSAAALQTCLLLCCSDTGRLAGGSWAVRHGRFTCSSDFRVCKTALTSHRVDLTSSKGSKSPHLAFAAGWGSGMAAACPQWCEVGS